MAYPWREHATPDSMGVFEIRAISVAICNMEIETNSDTWTAIEVHTDSTIALGAIKKGYSPSAAINTELCSLHRVSAMRKIFIANAVYVNTHENIADQLSRAVLCPSTSSSSEFTTWLWEKKIYRFQNTDDLELRIIRL